MVAHFQVLVHNNMGIEKSMLEERPNNITAMVVKGETCCIYIVLFGQAQGLLRFYPFEALEPPVVVNSQFL